MSSRSGSQARRKFWEDSVEIIPKFSSFISSADVAPAAKTVAVAKAVAASQTMLCTVAKSARSLFGWYVEEGFAVCRADYSAA